MCIRNLCTFIWRAAPTHLPQRFLAERMSFSLARHVRGSSFYLSGPCQISLWRRTKEKKEHKGVQLSLTCWKGCSWFCQIKLGDFLEWIEWMSKFVWIHWKRHWIYFCKTSEIPKEKHLRKGDSEAIYYLSDRWFQSAVAWKKGRTLVIGSRNKHNRLVSCTYFWMSTFHHAILQLSVPQQLSPFWTALRIHPVNWYRCAHGAKQNRQDGANTKPSAATFFVSACDDSWLLNCQQVWANKQTFAPERTACRKRTETWASFRCFFFKHVFCPQEQSCPAPTKVYEIPRLCEFLLRSAVFSESFTRRQR